MRVKPTVRISAGTGSRNATSWPDRLGYASAAEDRPNRLLIGLPALVAGTLLGRSLHGKLDEAAFRKVVLVLLRSPGWRSSSRAGDFRRPFSRKRESRGDAVSALTTHADFAVIIQWGFCDLPTRRHAQVSRPVSFTRRTMLSHPLIAPGKIARLLGTSLLFMTVFAISPATADDRSERPKTIVFVCLHGSVKSQMAAAHFNQIARERGLPFVAVSRGIAVDSSIPTRICDGLALEGLAPLDDVPRGLTAEKGHLIALIALSR